MTLKPNYAFSACISATSSHGRIDRADGQYVEIASKDLPDLLGHLATGGAEMPGRAKYNQMVLGEWFARQTAVRGGAHLRLVG